ncbi:hypothetical protein AAG906_006055 [Vitis piasezkii]
MISMIKLLNEMEILEAKINEETKVDMVLKTSSASFRQFKLNYTMNKLILKDQKVIHMEVNGSLTSSNKKKKKKGKNSKSTKQKGKFKKYNKKSKGNGKCFLNGKKGH